LIRDDSSDANKHMKPTEKDLFSMKGGHALAAAAQFAAGM